MQTHYSPFLVLISFAVAIFASYVTLDLVGSITQAKGCAKKLWLCGGALAMGLGIWSMHFIGMLAFSMPGMEMAYDIPLMALSIAIAIFASATALYIVSRPIVSWFSLIAGGFLFASTIAGMHYVGMFSMRMDAVTEWDTTLVILSIVIALMSSFAALFVSLRLRTLESHVRLQLLASLLMGLGIAGMHYTGMEAATFHHMHMAAVETDSLLVSSGLTTLVFTGTILILLLALAGTILNRAFASRKQKLDESARMYKEAEAANITKTRFLANMSHEIRTPISAIMGFAELAQDDDLSAADRKEYLKIIFRSARSLSQLVDEILDLSKIEMGHLKIETAGVDLKSFIDDILSLLQIKADEKGLLLKYSSETGPISSISTDAYRLRQIMVNVIGNAIKFTDRGQVAITQKFLEINGKRFIGFEVNDTGIGISEVAQQKLFTAFTQADNSMTRKFGGTGLGLDISRRLARALNGDLTLQSSVSGKGSQFLITIPLITNINKVTLNAPMLDTQITKSKQELENISVLLVEDVIDNQILIKRFLEKNGAVVEVANNGREAVEKAFARNFDIILMDIQMPIMDGHEATRTLRSKGYDKPIVALTAHAMAEEKENCLKSGCNDYLTKPINFSRLISVVAKYANH